MAIPTVELDVREQLRNKLEPFELIMNTVKALKKDDIFVLHATIKPTPLLGLLKIRGYSNHVRKVADDHWITTFVHKSQKHLLQELAIQEEQEAAAPKQEEPASAGHRIYTLDNRGLEAPQPMMRTLAQLEKMTPSDVLVITNDRVPMFLIEELNQMGCTYEVEHLPDDQARITIKKKQ